MNDLISIIIPVYNSEPYLEKTLDSIKRQTYSHIEILCINDGSTDGSLKILEEYASNDMRFRIFNQNNGGAGRARNVGLDNMRGKYLMFCDSDDWYAEIMCEEMVRAIKNTNADLVECGMSLYINQITPRVKFQINTAFNLCQRDKFINLDNPTRLFIDPYPVNKIYHVNKIKEYNIRFPNTKHWEDIAFMTEYISYSQVIYTISKKLYTYNIRPESLCDTPASLLSYLKALRHSINSINNNNMITEVSEFLLAKLVECIKLIISLGYRDYRSIFNIANIILRYFNKSKIKKFPLLNLISRKQYVLATLVVTNSYPVRLIRRAKRLRNQCKHVFKKHILLQDY